jgi:hypothetical protein
VVQNNCVQLFFGYDYFVGDQKRTTLDFYLVGEIMLINMGAAGGRGVRNAELSFLLLRNVGAISFFPIAYLLMYRFLKPHFF